MPRPPKTPLRAPPAFAVRAALALRRALLHAADLVVPAQLAVFERVAGIANAVVIAELSRLRVSDLVAKRSLSATELAEATKVDPDTMERTMRAAVALGLFKRDAQGRFTNNRLSSALRWSERYSVGPLVEYFGSGSNLAAWCDFGETLRTGQSAFERVHGKSVWEWFDEHPGERETFAECMMTMTLFEAPGIAAAYPFGDLRTLCDVGGGRGTLLSEVLVRNPKLRAMLCDAPSVLESARVLLSERGVLERVALLPGSFFNAVPKGADAYLMKNVLHDWDDERCIAILKNCRAAMERGQKLLVVEALIEDTTDNLGAFSDLQMLVVCSGGRERGRAAFQHLLDSSGFRLERVVKTPTPMHILESVAL